MQLGVHACYLQHFSCRSDTDTEETTDTEEEEERQAGKARGWKRGRSIIYSVSALSHLLLLCLLEFVSTRVLNSNFTVKLCYIAK